MKNAETQTALFSFIISVWVNGVKAKPNGEPIQKVERGKQSLNCHKMLRSIINTLISLKWSFAVESGAFF